MNSVELGRIILKAYEELFTWNNLTFIIQQIFHILVSIGSLTWINTWHKNRIVETVIKANGNFNTNNVESLFRQISGFLKLDMTYLLNPADVDEDRRSHSFSEKGYFNYLRNNEVTDYKFIFFEKANSDRNIITTVNLKIQEITFELNLKKQDHNKFKKLIPLDVIYLNDRL